MKEFLRDFIHEDDQKSQLSSEVVKLEERKVELQNSIMAVNTKLATLHRELGEVK